MDEASSPPSALASDATFTARFWRHVQKSDGCWLWTGSTDHGGYGKVTYQGRTLIASRVAYELSRGKPPARYVCHRCDNPLCCRPDHLFDGSAKLNMIDAANKGRAGRPQQLTDIQVAIIRQRLARGDSREALAKHFNVTPQFISQLHHGRRRTKRVGAVSTKVR